MTEGEKRRPGRPPKDPEKGQRRNYAFRLHDSVREKLIEAAAASNRTLSEEIEWRVERSFDIAPSDPVLGGIQAMRRFQASLNALPPISDQSSVASTPSGPATTVDLRELIEETVESTLRRFLGTRADDHPEHVQVLRRDDPRAIEAMEKSQQVFEGFTKRQGMKSPADNPDEPGQNGQPAKGAKGKSRVG